MYAGETYGTRNRALAIYRIVKSVVESNDDVIGPERRIDQPPDLDAGVICVLIGPYQLERLPSVGDFWPGKARTGP